MDSDSWAGVGLLALAVIAFLIVVAAEAGVVAGVRARALVAPPTSRLEALRQFTQERQATLSALALARNLTLIGITRCHESRVRSAVAHRNAETLGTANHHVEIHLSRGFNQAKRQKITGRNCQGLLLMRNFGNS